MQRMNGKQGNEEGDWTLLANSRLTVEQREEYRESTAGPWKAYGETVMKASERCRKACERASRAYGEICEKAFNEAKGKG